jgi:hypothetical protein
MRAALLLVLTACGSDSGECNPPSAPDYSCTSVALGTADTCSGGPAFNGMAYDVDKAFPIDCNVELPFCAAEFSNSVQTCMCTEFGDDVPQWVCPI